MQALRTVIQGLFVLCMVSGPTMGQTTARVSVDSDGTQADQGGEDPSISDDGRFVAFQSSSTDLVPNDTNNRTDIFVHDQWTGSTIRVSLSSTGAQANDGSLAPEISGDGRFVVFDSDADNLVSGDTNGSNDVFVHDIETRETTRVSVDSAGVQRTGASLEPSISRDGRFVAFSSLAPLVAEDTNTVEDVYVKDRQTGQVARASVSSTGVQASGSAARISADGMTVAFTSLSPVLVTGDTNGAQDVFVRDRAAGSTARVSVSSSGTQGNGISTYPSISADGRFVLFKSLADNLVPGSDTRQLYVHDRETGMTELASVSSSGVIGNRLSVSGVISEDGRYVLFSSDARNLVPNDTNLRRDIFLRDRELGETTLVSVDSAGVQGNGDCNQPEINSDGLFVVFHSTATNLAERDSNASPDVFVRDRRPCADGNVNAAAGVRTDVLFINDQARVAIVAARTPYTVRLATAPAGPDPASYIVWIWKGLPVRQRELVVGSTSIDCTVNPTPFDAGFAPRPFKCLLGGLGPEYGSGVTVMGVSPADAPWSLRNNRGVKPLVVTLQGVIEDSTAPSGLSVTNAVIFKSQ